MRIHAWLHRLPEQDSGQRAQLCRGRPHARRNTWRVPHKRQPVERDHLCAGRRQPSRAGDTLLRVGARAEGSIPEIR